MTPGARPAATLILLRDAEVGVEVLLMRRGAGASFMAGASVFPGGRVEADDSASDVLELVGPAALAHCRGALARPPERAPSAELAVGFYVAALREAFEEAGVLLARGPAPAGQARLQLREGARTFVEIVRDHALTLEVTALRPWAHWITPSAEPKRFDTRFFVAQVDAAVQASPDAAEAVELGWHTPAAALAAHAAGTLRLAPPTLWTLEELSPIASAAAVLQAAGDGYAAVLPKLVVDAEGATILMPWDPEYAAASGEGAERVEPSRRHRHPRGASRMVLVGGRFTSR